MLSHSKMTFRLVCNLLILTNFHFVNGKIERHPEYREDGFVEVLNEFSTTTTAKPGTGQPSDGGWSQWSELKECSPSCVQVQQRFCDSPRSANGAMDCDGDDRRTITCSGGLCSQDEENPAAKVTFIRETKEIPDENLDTFKEAVAQAERNESLFRKEVNEVAETGGVASDDAPTFKHQSLMNGTAKQGDTHLDALAIEGVTRVMKQELDDIELFLSFNDAVPSFKRCIKVDPCDVDSPYRTYDGSCNNRNYIPLGMAGTPFGRLVPNAYEDGVSEPRNKPADGTGELASPSTVSQAVTPDYNRTETVQVLMVMQWGQFIDHDLTLTPTPKATYGTAPKCCPDVVFKDGVFKEQPINFKTHPACFPIKIDENDSRFSKYNKTCMDFIRSQAAPNIHCTLGQREQMNAISHYLDASMIYGSDISSALGLRMFVDGKLRTQGEDLLPAGGQCPRDCFKAGDARVNEQVGLTLTHTIWVREHNRLADHFRGALPLASDEEIFQKARRVVIAEIQHITYNEFLQVVLGKCYMDKYGLTPTPKGIHSNGYDEKLDPSISNVFSTAAFRFGHSMIEGHIERQSVSEQDSSYITDEVYQFESQVFNPEGLIDMTFFKGLAHGLFGQGSQISDRFFVSTVRDFLFEEPGMPWSGLDLVALNIQRGRDHGLPSYTKYREYCQLSNITSFEDLGLTQDVLEAVMSVYDHVDDMDPYVGMLLEQPVGDAMIGPTFVCLILNQFSRLKFGDRYQYENILQPDPFPTAQLDAIKDVTLSRVFCDNVPGLDYAQPYAFYKPNEVWNPITPCTDIPALDLSVFS